MRLETESRPSSETRVESPEEVQSIVDNIIQESDLSFDREKSTVKYKLRYGSKLLTLYCSVRDWDCITTIENVGEPASRKPRETTMLYRAVKQIMEGIIAGHDMFLDYSIITDNDSMRKWAETTGNELFDWDLQYADISDKNYPPLFVFHKTLYPEAREAQAAA